jgi:ComF family protein
MNYLKDVFQLFFPKICVTCDAELYLNERLICTLCRHDLPVIQNFDFKKNKIFTSFYGRIPIEFAGSFLYYSKVGKTKTLVQHLKYKNNQEIGAFVGNWFGEILKESKQFTTIDYIVPVPLHRKKLKKRGYNQLTTFGLSLAQQLKTKYNSDMLIQTSATKTQTDKQRFERFNTSETPFSLTNSSFFENKHILLIDDVITTGATLASCCHELLKTNGIKISIVTIAYTI